MTSVDVVRALLVGAVETVARRVGEPGDDEIGAEELCGYLTTALSAAPWPSAGFRVRRDRLRGETDVGGAWRFDVVIERPDGVLAVIDVCARESGARARAVAFARLGLARARGVAESAFLVATVEVGANLYRSSVSTTDEASADPASPLAVVEGDASAVDGWGLALWEAPEAPADP